ncbi:rhamnulokinase [Candidatus Fermentibacteria bacterium]|nr:rhamnulokinase [Candidatus Fermentibacteria bacterium]
MRCVAVDVGAGSGRVLLGSFGEGRIELEELHRFGNAPVSRGGHLRWDVDRLFDEIRAGLALVRERTGAAPDSIGVNTWGVDFVLLDGDGNLLDLPVSYRDHRTKGRMDSFLRRFDARRLYARTGIQFLRINTLYQLCALVEDSPELLKRADRLLMIPDYLHYRLSGRMAMELTNATTTQMVNVHRSEWDPEILRAVPLPESLLSTPVRPGTRLGTVDASACDLPGLENTEVVVPATHDTASAVAACPAVEDEWAFVSSGTWCLMGTELAEPVVDEEARRLNFTNEGGAGETYCFLRNLTGLWILRGLRDSLPGAPSYDDMERMAERAEPLRRLIDPDHPLFFHPESMTAAVDEYCRRTGQEAPAKAGEYVRCALESLALSFARTLEHLRRVQPKEISRVHMVGGGCRSRLLGRMACDSMQLPLICGPVEAAALGNLLVQAVSLGELPDLASARRLAYSSVGARSYEPGDAQPWGEAVERFRRLTGEGGDF